MYNDIHNIFHYYCDLRLFYLNKFKRPFKKELMLRCVLMTERKQYRSNHNKIFKNNYNLFFDLNKLLKYLNGVSFL